MRFSALCVAAVLSLVLPGVAEAGFLAHFSGTSPAGPNTAYNYDLLFSTQASEERLETGDGTINPGTIGSADFITLYDVGFVGPGAGANFVGATAGPGFSVSTQNVGSNAAQTLPLDNPFLTNVTFRYTGPNISTNTTFSGFSILVSNNDGVSLKQYTSQRTDNLGSEIGAKISELGTIAAPVTNVIPEPSTIALAAFGALGFWAAWKRRS